jgi:hypothetical protein
MNFDKILAEINQIVTWYGKHKNPNPGDLMDQYRKLTGYLWYYAVYVAETKTEYNQKYFIRKIETVREKDRLVKSKLAVNKAEIEAMLSTETQFLLEMEAESLAYKADLLLKQGNRVCDAIRTHISLLKKEAEQNEGTH